MRKLRIPKVKVKPKDFTKLPWTEEFRTKYPTDIVEQIVKKGIPIDDLRDYLFVERHMDFRKANLVVGAYQQVRGIVRNDSEVLLEICVPFCDNQCSNCDRTIYKRTNKSFGQYFCALKSELEATRTMIRKKGYFVKAVCFKGNVLVFSVDEISELLSLVAYPLCEICVEISDTKYINREKLDIFKRFANVRFILNALSFNMVTLRSINKHFELREVGENLALLREYPFELNVSLVVGMGKERDLQLIRNLKIAIQMGANCIDLYSRLCPRIANKTITDSEKIAEQRKLLEIGNDFLTEQKFKPYFLYCTEVENGCFENVGYCQVGMKCKYLEDKMYGVSSIIGCGVCAESMIIKNLANSRQFYKNTTDLQEYVNNTSAILRQKLEFFE